MAGVVLSVEEMVAKLKTKEMDWKEEVSLLRDLIDNLGQVKDHQAFFASLEDFTKKINNLRSGYVSEIFRFFKDVISHFHGLEKDVVGFV